jgi:hypothetical protein
MNQCAKAATRGAAPLCSATIAHRMTGWDVSSVLDPSALYTSPTPGRVYRHRREMREGDLFVSATLAMVAGRHGGRLLS